MSEATENTSVHELLADFFTQKIVKVSKSDSGKKYKKKKSKKKHKHSDSSDEDPESHRNHSKRNYVSKRSCSVDSHNSECSQEYDKRYKSHSSRTRKHKKNKSKDSPSSHKRKHKRRSESSDSKKPHRTKRKKRSNSFRSDSSNGHSDIDMKKDSQSSNKNDTKAVKSSSQNYSSISIPDKQDTQIQNQNSVPQTMSTTNYAKLHDEVTYGPMPLSEILVEQKVNVVTNSNDPTVSETKRESTTSVVTQNQEEITTIHTSRPDQTEKTAIETPKQDHGEKNSIEVSGIQSRNSETESTTKAQPPNLLLSEEAMLKIVKMTSESTSALSKSNVKSKLSSLKREELVGKSSKYKDSNKDISVTKRKKSSKQDDSRRKKSSSPRRSSKYDSRSSRRYDYSPRKSTNKSSRRSSKERNRHSPKTSRISESSINKAKLLEVAKKNVLAMVANGTLPGSISAEILKKEQMASALSSKSVKEFTDFCRNLSSKEEASVQITTAEEESEQPFIHHPFKLKEVSTIKLNIKNSVQIPIKSHAENITENARTLSLQFPVSSGNQHRQKELEWIPVQKDEPKPTNSSQHQTMIAKDEDSLQLVPLGQPSILLPPPPPPPLPVPPMQPPPPPPEPLMNIPFTYPINVPMPPQVIPKPPLPASIPEPTNQNQCFPISTGKTVKPADLQAVVVKHYQARTKLEQNPHDIQALQDFNAANLQIQTWVKSQQVPGQFTGSTDAKLLSVQELSGPKPVWVKKDTFIRAAPVTEGKGMSLLKKMGWNPGEGLGKNKEGSLEPLLLDIKTDKKGLVSINESGNLLNVSTNVTNCNKHPVSVLMEMCSKRKWLPPTYEVVQESGPPHKRLFIFKVNVNNKAYQPLISRLNKKQAKAEAAVVCLQALGVLPEEYTLP